MREPCLTLARQVRNSSLGSSLTASCRLLTPAARSSRPRRVRMTPRTTCRRREQCGQTL